MLVLDIEEPKCYTEESEDEQELNQEEFLPSKNISQTHIKSHDQNIIEDLRSSHLVPSLQIEGRVAVREDKIPEWSYKKQDDRMSEQAIGKSLPSPSGPILLNCDEVDITNIPFFQLTGMAMMVVVHFSPIFVWNGREKTTDKTNNIINALGFHKRLMATIMLNDKYSYQEEYVNQSY